MATSKAIAALVGPVLAAAALSVLVNLKTWPSLVEQAFSDGPLIYVTGYLTFAAGIAIVRVHNRWTAGWPVLVTLSGWMALLGGLMRTLFPTRLAGIAVAAVSTPGVLPSVAALLLLMGAVLCVKGYFGRE